MSTLAPIALFVYNRPECTLKTLEALQANHLSQQSELFVFCDGPKPNASADELSNIGQVREIALSKNWCGHVELIKSDYNKGLANSIIQGVTEIVNRFGKIIVLEDDILTSPYFLTFLNGGLTTYSGSGNVYSINSYMFPISTICIDSFLSPLATSTWGWATWSDKWSCFERNADPEYHIRNSTFLKNRFNFGSVNFTDMLNNKNSWGICWYYSVFGRNGLGLFPTQTLSRNIGFGNQATHTKTEFDQQPLFLKNIPVVKKNSIDFEFNEKLYGRLSRDQNLRIERSLVDRFRRWLQ